MREKKEITCWSTHSLSSPIISGVNNVLAQNKNADDELSTKQILEDVMLIVKRLKDGSTDDLLAMLVTNNMQLQTFNKIVTNNIMGEIGKPLENFEILSKMQLRVMNETRKNIMAINEICNPKRTTFVKEANQHNHLHQKIYERKQENKNELQKSEQLEAPAVVTDAEIMPLKDKVQ